MDNRMATRRTALLAGAATLLAGCDTMTDLAERVLGTAKLPLAGERVAVANVNAARPVDVDADAASRSLTLPAPQLNADWLQPGGNLLHAPGHPVLPQPLSEAWRTNIGSGNSYRYRMTANPIITTDSVYAMDAFGWVSALDVARGDRRWQTDTRPRSDRDGALGGAIEQPTGLLSQSELFGTTRLFAPGADLLADNRVAGSILRARDAASGTTPPHFACSSIWLAMTFERISRPTRTAALVSSQLDSIASRGFEKNLISRTKLTGTAAPNFSGRTATSRRHLPDYRGSTCA
jgi:hypothetical protein